MAAVRDGLHYSSRLAPILIQLLEYAAQMFPDRDVLHIVDGALELVEKPSLIRQLVERSIDLSIYTRARLI